MMTKWLHFVAGNDVTPEREAIRNKIMNRFTLIAGFLKSPDKSVSKNEYDRLLGYSFHLAKLRLRNPSSALFELTNHKTNSSITFHILDL